MRVFLLIIAVISAILGIIFSVLPFGLLALIPGIVTFVAAGACYFITKREQKSTKLPIALLILGIAIIIAGVTKSYLVADEVVLDEEFEKKEELREEESIEELKEIEELEEIEDVEEK